ncbi:MAG TPA: hypothetical protein VGC99_25085 [Candidatus Tectomicrobia bacterium]
MNRPVALTHRLEAKILLSIGASLLLGFGVLLALNIRHGTQELVRQGMEKSTLLAAAVIKSIQNNMVQGRADIARRLVEDLKTMPNLMDLHIYRRDGTLAFQDLETLHQVEALQTRQKDEGTLAALKVIEEGIRTFHPRFERPTWTVHPAQIEQVVRTGQPLHFDATIEGQGRYVQLTPLPSLSRRRSCRARHLASDHLDRADAGRHSPHAPVFRAHVGDHRGRGADAAAHAHSARHFDAADAGGIRHARHRGGGSWPYAGGEC